MQVRRQYLPIASKYDHLFSKNQKSNRVELLSDFPKGNDAEVISSLQVSAIELTAFLTGDLQCFWLLDSSLWMVCPVKKQQLRRELRMDLCA